MPIISGLIKYNSQPPVWFMDVDGGGRLELSTSDLQHQEGFQRRCMESLNMMPPPLNKTAWQQLIQGLLDGVTVVEVPKDSSPSGQLLEHVERFCLGRAQAHDRNDILLGKPWFDEDKKVHCFRMTDLLTYLENKKFREFKVHQITSILQQNGGDHIFFNIKGKGINCWTVPAFQRQEEGHDLPDYEGGIPY
jgi:hypothetical protein